jgi:hypothetical protein
MGASGAAGIFSAGAAFFSSGNENLLEHLKKTEKEVPPFTRV